MSRFLKDFESEGRRFDSCQAHQYSPVVNVQERSDTKAEVLIMVLLRSGRLGGFVRLSRGESLDGALPVPGGAVVNPGFRYRRGKNLLGPPKVALAFAVG